MRITQFTGSYPWARETSMSKMSGGVISHVLTTRRAELTPDVSVDPEYVAVIPATRAKMVFPLINHERFIGIMNLETDDPAKFTLKTFDFLKLLVSRIATAIDNSHLYEVSQSQYLELQALYEKVNALEHLKSDMIRIASHDLKNPIGLISGFFTLLKDDLWNQLSLEHKEWVRLIEKSTERMVQITTDILSLERIENTKKVSEKQLGGSLFG